MSDMFHLKAIEIISKSLRGAVDNTPEGREGMALGQYVAGMGFSNVGLGIVHSMAHPLGARYDTPHGVANAIILPTVMEYNAPATGEKYRDIAKAMGVEGTENMSVDEYRKAAVEMWIRDRHHSPTGNPCNKTPFLFPFPELPNENSFFLCNNRPSHCCQNQTIQYQDLFRFL